MNEIFWVGLRESDIMFSKNIFTGSIVLFGNDSENTYAFNSYRANQNFFDDEIRNFYLQSVYKVLKNYPDAKFIFYNQKTTSFMPKEISNRILYYVDEKTRQLISDKILVRKLLRDLVSIPPYSEILGENINFKYVKSLFGNLDNYIVQDSLSGGGIGTYIYNSKSRNVIEKLLSPRKQYLVSEFLPNVQPINVHAFIAHDGKITVYPGSVQLIRQADGAHQYIGADFSAYGKFDEEIKIQIHSIAVKICERIYRYGYAGVLGIDFLLSGNKIYFCEINTRFQGSTIWLDELLTRNGLSSIFENYLDRSTYDIDKLKNFDISGLMYYGNDPKLAKFYKICEQNSQLSRIDRDGYNEHMPVNEKSYLFRLTFNRNISWKPEFSENRVSENLMHYNFQKESGAKLKTVLLSCGVRLSHSMKKYLSIFKMGVFTSLDIKFSNGVCVNVPFGTNFSEYSPYSLNEADGNIGLYFYDEFVDNITVELYSPTIYNTMLKSNVLLSDIFYLATDRIRIKMQNGCDLKLLKKGCKFCYVPPTNRKFDVDEIIENIPLIERAIQFRHYMIGGGSNLTESSWKDVEKIASAIKSFSGKEVSLMSIAPSDLNTMLRLKNAGIDDVSFNLEICNDKKAVELMPYKGIPRNKYIKCLKQAVIVWGKFNVRSILLLGLEDEATTLKMVKKLCSIGVQPVLSLFRPVEHSELEFAIPLSSNKAYEIFVKADKICQSYNTELGPKCRECRNNTLSY